jgi:uroporphyrinogen-III synthase
MNHTGLPLLGKRILVTRAESQSGVFSDKIRQAGGVPTEVPLIMIRKPLDTTPLQEAIREIETFQWIVFSSVNGVAFFLDAFLQEKKLKSNLHNIKIAAIGEKTKQYLIQQGLPVHFIPSHYIAEEFVREFKEIVYKGDKLLHPRGNLARDILSAELKQLDAEVMSVIAYETVCNDDAGKPLAAYLQSSEIDIITFTSSSTVSNFVQLLATYNWKKWVEGIPVACIGPVTAETAVNHSFHPLIVAEEYTIDGLIEALSVYFSKEDL